MNSLICKASLAAILALSLPVLAETAMTKEQYKAEQDNIASRYKSAKAGCDSLSGNANDICVADAKGKRDVAKAELEARYKPSAKALHEVDVTKAEANYAVSKEMCDDKAGNDKDVCVKEAKAALTRAKAEEKVDAARSEAAADKREADFAVAREKCNAFAGSAKDQCIAEAKARFGKK